MRKRAKVDGTHGEIVQTFRQCGWAVLSLAPLGNGAPDLLVFGYKHGSRYLYLVEVKAAKGKLRHEQELFGARWPVQIIRSADEALAFMGLSRQSLPGNSRW